MASLVTNFREVRDPRDLNARHDLAAMLFMALAATLCGAKSCVEIADFAAANEDLLSEIVDLPHGVASHDSFSRVFRLLDPEEMAGVFARFRDALRAALGLGTVKGVVAVDGKSLRRAYERGRAFMPPLMVSVWDAETRLSLMSRHAPGGDEVAATLEALKAITLKGCTVTADALHCHPAMAEAARARGAHYALRLKANHGPLFACVKKAFADADASRALTVHEQSESGHARRERRRASVFPIPPADPARRASLSRPCRFRPHRIRTNRRRQDRSQGPLRRPLEGPRPAPLFGNHANALERREPASLAARRRLP